MYTGFWIEDNHILGPKESGKFRIDNGYIKGPYNSKQFWIDYNRIWGPKESGKFWIYNGYIYGPSENLPWMESNEPRNTHPVVPDHQASWAG
jgi:hypothetical protein